MNKLKQAASWLNARKLHIFMVTLFVLVLVAKVIVASDCSDRGGRMVGDGVVTYIMTGTVMMPIEGSICSLDR